jgi:3-methyladenine DNA glycosylase AlkD
MTLQEIMEALAAMGTERTKKIYMSQGAVEPLFGVATGAMKPLAKMHKNDQAMAEALFETGNYDAMYLAGMIADVKQMQPADYERWMKKAYFSNISTFIISVTLAESDYAQEVADRFISDGDDIVMAGGWSCYEWLLGSRKDDYFDKEKLRTMLGVVESTYESMPRLTKRAMMGFLVAVGVSYMPLHEAALLTAQKVDASAYESIQKETSKGRLGFKRKHVRC